MVNSVTYILSGKIFPTGGLGYGFEPLCQVAPVVLPIKIMFYLPFLIKHVFFHKMSHGPFCFYNMPNHCAAHQTFSRIYFAHFHELVSHLKLTQLPPVLDYDFNFGFWPKILALLRN